MLKRTKIQLHSQKIIINYLYELGLLTAKLKKPKNEFSLSLSSCALTLLISPLNHFISGLLSQSFLTHLSFHETQPCHRSTQT
jgi:hypothetical protein